MTDENFGRIEALFNAAMSQPQALRRSFLESMEPDAGIRNAVLRLLMHANGDSEDPIDTRLRSVLNAEPAPMPRSIGAYRVLRQIGEGGMGAVFLAERDTQGTLRKVAIKLLQGMATKTSRRRMARERELLGELNHPHIASLIDGGDYEGRPYLVMDYIEGDGLTHYLAERRPTLSERLRLHLQCCEAVQHAHERLILHRDLKPSNIVVSKDGTPVLLDFGIGKLLQHDHSEDAHTATLAFTPGYAAPEQLRGEEAGTATDVFGLGALLFDILTEKRLSTLRKGDMPVPLPSASAADPQRARALRGDLDRIVMKATARAPAARYRTAASLAEDIQRYLQGKPILAAPDALGYRMRKFVVRHRWGVAASVLMTAMAGLFVWQLDAQRQRALRAERSSQRDAMQATASRDFLLSVLAATNPNSVDEAGDSTTVQSLLATAVKRLAQDRSQDARARMHAWMTIAEAYKGRGNPAQQLFAADQARALLAGMGQPDPDLQPRIEYLRATALSQLERYQEAKAILQTLIAAQSKRGGDALQLAQLHYDFGVAASVAGEYDDAQIHYSRVLALLKSANQGAPGNLRLHALLALVNLHWKRYATQKAEPYLAQALTLAGQVLERDDPQWQRLHRSVAMVRTDQGRYPEALHHAQQALSISEQFYGAQSRDTSVDEIRLADVLNHLEQYDQAIAHNERAVAILRGLRLDEKIIAREGVSLAAYHLRAGRPQRAIDLLNNAVTQLQKEEESERTWLRAAYMHRGAARAQLRQFAVAQRDFVTALQYAHAGGQPRSAEEALVLAQQTQAFLEAGNSREASAALQALKRIDAQLNLQPATPEWAELIALEARLALVQGDPLAAEKKTQEALQAARQVYGTQSVKVAELQLLRSQLLYQQGKVQAAVQQARQAIEWMGLKQASDSPRLRNARKLLRTFERDST